MVAKVEWHPGELYPRVGFIVTNLSRPAERVVAFYNQRGTAEQWIKEGKNAIKWTRLSCCSFAANAVRLQLHALVCNLTNFMRTLALSEAVKQWPLTHGRARSAKNAFRHGLSLPIQFDQALCEEVQALALQIAGSHASAHIQLLARRVAEAQVDLRRVRYARQQFLSGALAKNPYDYEPRAVTRAKFGILKHFLKPKLADIPLPAFVMNFVTAAPDGPTRFATALSKETKRLLALDRYERRALSRRKFAIRAFDEARQRYYDDCIN